MGTLVIFIIVEMRPAFTLFILLTHVPLSIVFYVVTVPNSIFSIGGEVPISSTDMPILNCVSSIVFLQEFVRPTVRVFSGRILNFNLVWTTICGSSHPLMLRSLG